ncbi:hypothetical protein O9G_002611 [Rozella allomycis CSF55]|uniref:Uncharacterized protein n=1 Tax=Rozella allomycis (strain CSF55) TaxID=988480 RepID=A0A075APQ3_ROZAC|nr:hypothetical protein O9G_002611 [Rozella allomycis CSF55]|eukprot:EPZ32116.1 hypothetical protein O9G_002611 [Rozella allomycis CSF55]
MTLQSSLSVIFRFKKWHPSSEQTIPSLNEAHPLSLFYFSDDHLVHACEELEKIRDVRSLKYQRALEKVHRAQRLVLNTFNLVYSEMDESIKAPRTYRSVIPREDQMELEDGFSENILFAAEAISRGFRIRGIENYTDLLKHPAVQLHGAFEAVRFVFRNRAMNNPEPPYHDLVGVMTVFDQAWAKFEQEMCICYFGYHMVRGVDTIAESMNKTIEETVEKGLIKRDDIIEYDPSMMFIVPRLTLLHMLREGDFGWFCDRVGKLNDLEKKVKKLDKEEFEELERMLCLENQEGRVKVKKLFISISNKCDMLHSGHHSKEVVSLLSQVFKKQASL